MLTNRRNLYSMIWGSPIRPCGGADKFPKLQDIYIRLYHTVRCSARFPDKRPKSGHIWRTPHTSCQQRKNLSQCRPCSDSTSVQAYPRIKPQDEAIDCKVFLDRFRNLRPGVRQDEEVVLRGR